MESQLGQRRRLRSRPQELTIRSTESLLDDALSWSEKPRGAHIIEENAVAARMAAVGRGGVNIAFWVLAEAAFAAMDTNDNGVVDEKDGKHRKAAAEAWEAADGNSDKDDGKLTLEEVQYIEIDALVDLLDDDRDGDLDAAARCTGDSERRYLPRVKNH